MALRSRIIFYIVFLAVFALALKLSLKGFARGKDIQLSPDPERDALANRLQAHVRYFASDIGDRTLFNPPKLEKAASYIQEQLRSAGYDVKRNSYMLQENDLNIRNRNLLGENKFDNIIAEKTGTEKPGEIIIIGAHYDSCSNPGADDNASGVAGVLETAKMLKNRNTKRTIRFVSFVNEEPPSFQTEDMGSLVYARDAKSRGDDIRAAIILEMVGYYSDEPGSQTYPPFIGFFYPDRGNYAAVVGKLKYFKLVREVRNRFRKNSAFPVESLAAPEFVPGLDFSDHWSFWQAGYPAVMVTDTSFYRNRNYHRQTDTPETLNYVYMAEVIRGMAQVLAELADSSF
jgi:Zn-dependent M28 family amino/carboxypeptidase